MARVKEKEQAVKSADPQAAQENLEVAAYYHWLGRGCPNDDSLTDWLEAERELNGNQGPEFKNN